MSELETNIYRITNLRDLASTYRTYQVVNLHRDQDEYFQNCQLLTRKLSFKLKSPAAVIDRKDEAILVVKQDSRNRQKRCSWCGGRSSLNPWRRTSIWITPPGAPKMIRSRSDF